MTNPKHGGPGRGQGRRPVADTPTKHYTVTLDDNTAGTVRDYGEGNLSAGIRAAAKLVPGSALKREASRCPTCGQVVKENKHVADD